MSVTLSTILSIILTVPSAAGTLTVAAASDLTNVEPALAAAFRKNEPTVDVHFVTSASGVLAQQIANGAPYDVFLSANAKFLDQLATGDNSSRKIDPGSVIVYAVGRLGILWNDGKSHPLNDLKAKTFRLIAVPNPKLAPYGVAAEEALRHEGVWDFVSQKVVYGENVRQTLQLFESGNADVVITSEALLQGKPAAPIPAEWHRPIVQKAGTVTTTNQPLLARKFVSFLKSPEAQAVFAKFGFTPLDATGHKPPEGP